MGVSEFFEDPQYCGEDPGVDLREPVINGLKKVVGNLGKSPDIAIVTDFDDLSVEVSNIKLTKGEERGTLFAKVYETVDEHKVLVFAGSVAVAAGLAAIHKARVKSRK